jgi:hypothetical protein
LPLARRIQILQLDFTETVSSAGNRPSFSRLKTLASVRPYGNNGQRPSPISTARPRRGIAAGRTDRTAACWGIASGQVRHPKMDADFYVALEGAAGSGERSRRREREECEEVPHQSEDSKFQRAGDRPPVSVYNNSRRKPLGPLPSYTALDWPVRYVLGSTRRRITLP